MRRTKKYLESLVVVCGIVLMAAACGTNTPETTADGNFYFTEEEIEKAKAVVWEQFDEENCYGVTTFRTYQWYLSNLRYEEELQKKNKPPYGTEGRWLYLQGDVIDVLVEANEGSWEQYEERPDFGFWLIADDSEAGFQIIGMGY